MMFANGLYLEYTFTFSDLSYLLPSIFTLKPSLSMKFTTKLLSKLLGDL